ncbi:MAG: hypothetical protein IH859_02335 [Chloroflexi bacterium]|nr:hypothetical protein [Chloroflexota bacterium]
MALKANILSIGNLLNEDSGGKGATKTKKGIVFLLILFYAFVMVKNAWISDDSFITMRTVDNFLNGYGLTWNVGERVQSYSHPLWMFVLIIGYAVIRDPFVTLYLISIVTSLIAVTILITKLANTLYAAILGITILSFSMAFVDYSTSGLENPLTHLLFSLFLIMYLKAKNVNEHRLFVLSLIAAFAAVNRLDTLLFYIPILAYSLWNLKSKKALVAITLGFSPLALWEMFSIFYYGFPFPNTYYAKLGTGIDIVSLMKQGIVYYENSLFWDPLTLITIAVAVAVAVFISFFEKETRGILISAGILLYLLYVLRIGGGFMSGRFFSTALLGAVALILQINVKIKQPVYILAILAAIIISLTTDRPPILTTFRDGKQFIPENGVANERLYYFQWTGLVKVLRSEDFPNFDWVVKAKKFRETGFPVTKFGAIGFSGFYVGSDVHIIDKYGLADPLLARIPTSDLIDWRIGHFERDLPELYWETVKLRSINRIEDPNLRIYYDKLSVVTKGNLFDWDRMLEIWRFNTGYYDPLIEAYIQTLD